MGYHKTIFYKLVLNWLTSRKHEQPVHKGERTAQESHFVDPELNREQDLQRFGTSQGVINVGDGILNSPTKPPVCTTVVTEDQANGQWQKDKARFATSQGVVNVARLKERKICYTQHTLQKPSNKRFKTSYAKDLGRFGTSQGIIHVAQDGGKKQRKLKPKVRQTSATSINPYADIYKEFSKAQVTIQNKTNSPKEITLWGAKPEVYTEPSGFQNIESQTLSTSVTTGVHPQGIAYNPANASVYIVNQLSGTVTILNSNNEVAATVQLDPSFPGMCSPTAVTINTNPASSRYGYAYVCCSVSNAVQVIDTAFNVIKSTSTGLRPVAICFNPVNNTVYTANLVDNSITVIDAESIEITSVSPLNAGAGPIGLGVNPTNGELYVCNSASNDLTVFNASNQYIITVSAVGQRPVSVTYNPANGFLYVTATISNELLKINPSSYTLVSHIPVGRSPYNAFYLSANQYLYVQNRQDGTLTVLNSQDGPVGSLRLSQQYIGGAYNPQNNSIYISDTLNNAVNVITFGQAATSVTVSNNYAELQADFQSNIAIIQHARFIVSGTERLTSFRVNKKTITGSTSIRRLSFEQFASPQNWQNVTECTALGGTVVDAKTNWKFMLPARQTVSVLIWFKQLELLNLIPENPNTNTLMTEKK